MFYLTSIIFTLLLNEFINCSLLSETSEVIGCGGFIKSNTEINYEIIKVKLFTKEKILKYTAESSSVNGYYMIPIYNKGEYIIKVDPPPGWSFEPNEISLNVDGETDPCTKNEDINFYFKGFGLSGKVVTYGDKNLKGPENVRLDLLLNNAKIDSTLSAKDGTYYYSNVMPDNYVVVASHPTWKFKTNKVSVTLSKDNWSAKENIVVSGYDISGYVLTTDKKGVKNAVCALKFADSSAKSDINTKEFECNHEKSDVKTQIDKNQLCFTRTNEHGKFEFKNIAYQNYEVKCLLQDEQDSIVYKTKPEKLNVNLITHKNIEIEEKFYLDNVSIKSKVTGLDNTKQKLSSVVILLNDKPIKVNINEKNGEFSLDDLTIGKYKLSAKLDHIYFEQKQLNVDLTEKFLTSKQALLLNSIDTTSFDLCGSVRVKQQIDPDSVKVLVSQPETNKKLSVSLDKDFNYCVKLDKSNADYVITVGITDTKLQSHLRLVPSERRVKVVDKPVNDVNFAQLEAKLEVKITFKDEKSCKPDMILYMRSADASNKWSKQIEIKCEVDEKSKQTQFKFELANILFGNYYLNTNYDDFYCWNEYTDNAESFVFNINKESQSVELKHVGYKLNYKIDYKNVALKIENKQREKVIEKRIESDADLESAVCLPSQQDYYLTQISCHLFKCTSNNVQTIDEKTYLIQAGLIKKYENKVILNGYKHKLDVKLVLDKANSNLSPNNLKEFQVNVYRADDETLQQQIEKIEFKTIETLQDTVTVRGSSWFESDGVLRFVPKSTKFLFEPEFIDFQMNSDNCDSNKIEFNTKLGIFLKGHVKQPNIENINVVVKSSEDDSVVYYKGTFNSQNDFYLGPFKEPHTLYKVEIEKNGHLFRAQEMAMNKNGEYEMNYDCEKLGSLQVHIKQTDNIDLIENALVSLSSSNRKYRRTIKSDLNGLAVFDNLEPDLYYLLIMMQEYLFEPNSKTIQIIDGANVDISINAKRVAYSCMGKVTTINGSPESSIHVEAVGLNSDECKQSQENAKSDPVTGVYRIRDLKPNCDYRVSYKTIGTVQQQQQRIMPTHYDIHVTNEDKKEVNFVSLDVPTYTDVNLYTSLVTFSVDSDTIKSQYKNFIRIKLVKTSQPDNILQTQTLPANSVIHLNQLKRDNEQYTIHVELLAASTSLISQQQQLQAVIDKAEVTFIADKLFQQLNVKFDLDNRKQGRLSGGGGSGGYDSYYASQQNSFLTLPLFLIITAIVYYKFKEINEFIGQLKVKLEKSGLYGSIVGGSGSSKLKNKSNNKSAVNNNGLNNDNVQILNNNNNNSNSNNDSSDEINAIKSGKPRVRKAN